MTCYLSSLFSELKECDMDNNILFSLEINMSPEDWIPFVRVSLFEDKMLETPFMKELLTDVQSVKDASDRHKILVGGPLK